MNHGRILKADNKSCLIPKVSRTTNFLERMRGLLFSPPLADGEALLIKPCGSVHTMGMSYAIDLIFLDNHWAIVKIVSNLPPWRSSRCRKAKMVLELRGGSIESLDLLDGQQLEWDDEPEH